MAFYGSAFEQIPVFQIVLGIIISVELERFYIHGILVIVRSIYYQIITILQMQGRFFEQRGSKYIFIGSRTYRVESLCREERPGRSLTVIFITSISVGTGSIHAIHHLA